MVCLGEILIGVLTVKHHQCGIPDAPASQKEPGFDPEWFSKRSLISLQHVVAYHAWQNLHCFTASCLFIKGNLIFSKSEGAFVSTKQRFSFASCKLQVIFKGPIYRASPSDAPKNHVLRFISGHVDHDQPARSLL